MGKALAAGVNPYLPIPELAKMFVGNVTFFPHPAPCPPFLVILSTLLSLFSYNQSVVIWFIIELACFFGFAFKLSELIDDRLNWLRVITIFFSMLAWYLVMVELYLGQLSILLIFLLTTALVALRKNRIYLAGILIGITIALKIITWPLLLYFALKKDWRAVLAGSLTVFGLNLVALAGMGIGPFFEYYFQVSRQVTAYYQGIIYNMSLWSLGFRLFGGSASASVDNYFNAPALFNLPSISWLISILFVGSFLSIGLIWAVRSKDPKVSFSILISLVIAVGPTSWHHYYVMIIPILFVVWQSLAKLSFPLRKTLLLVILVLMFFFVNNITNHVIIYLNGGLAALEKNNYQITFASSLLIYLPLAELMMLCILLWRTVKAGERKQQMIEKLDLEVSAS